MQQRGRDGRWGAREGGRSEGHLRRQRRDDAPQHRQLRRGEQGLQLLPHGPLPRRVHVPHVHRHVRLPRPQGRRGRGAEGVGVVGGDGAGRLRRGLWRRGDGAGRLRRGLRRRRRGGGGGRRRGALQEGPAPPGGRRGLVRAAHAHQRDVHRQRGGHGRLQSARGARAVGGGAEPGDGGGAQPRGVGAGRGHGAAVHRPDAQGRRALGGPREAPAERLEQVHFDVGPEERRRGGVGAPALSPALHYPGAREPLEGPGGGGGGRCTPYGVVWVTRCCGSQADTQSQQNKILISGTRGAFRSGNRSSVMMPAPRYWAAAVFFALQPPPPLHGPDSMPKAFPYPNTRHNRSFQPPVTAPPQPLSHPL